VNWGIPDFSQSHLVVLSTYTSFTGQWLMRTQLRERRWLFWGERLNRNVGWKGVTQRALTAPISHASGIVGIGRAAREDYYKRFPHVRQFCIPYHCDLSEFLAVRRCPEENEPLTFLFCGQMILRKGVDLLLLAFDRLIARGFDVRLLLVGREADLPKFLELVRPDTRSKICYEGFQAPERLPEYFGKGDVFVLPSRHDGWGVVVNQALAAGLPIITSDAVGAGLDLIENGINGMRVCANDPEALYSAMEAFARNRRLACEWGRRSREKAPNVASNAGAEKWVQVFDSLMTHAG
jgi:glycosyltransferase involved in cell wall biosynthesis